MKEVLSKTIITSLITLLILITSLLLPSKRCEAMSSIKSPEIVELPAPRHDSNFSVERALLERRSVRSYSKNPLTLNEISQILWASQGITRKGVYRTAPSAGALYPLEAYIVVGNVTDLAAGVYNYKPHEHKLVRSIDGDKRADLCQAALSQSPVKNAPAVLVICAVYERTTGKYGERGIRYVLMEAGHAAQNICLQAVSLDLKSVVIGAFSDREVKRITNCKPNEHPLYIIPIGR